jgi:hypothetical protein
MKPIHPTPAELQDPECAAFFATLDRIHQRQAEHAKELRKLSSMDYVAVKEWATEWELLRDREKEARRPILGFRRRYLLRRPTRWNAPAAACDASEGCSCENARGAGAGAPTRQTSGDKPRGHRSLLGADKS